MLNTSGFGQYTLDGLCSLKLCFITLRHELVKVISLTAGERKEEAQHNLMRKYLVTFVTNNSFIFCLFMLVCICMNTTIFPKFVLFLNVSG